MSDSDGGIDEEIRRGIGTDEGETRIGFALTRSANRDLLADLLSWYDLVDIVDEVPDGMGLCLVDDAGLERSRAALEAWQGSAPARNPVLLLVEGDTENLWQRHGLDSDGVVNAIQQIPAPRAAVDAVLDSPTSGSDRLDELVPRIHPADRPAFADRLERAIEHGEPYDLEFRIETRSGDERWIRARAKPQFEDGELRRVRETVQDVTAQKEQQQELERMTHAVDHAPIGVSISDPDEEDNPLTYVNEGFVSLTGYDREEVLGRNCRFLQGPETDPETVARIRRAVDAGESVSVVLRNYRKNGTPFWNSLDIGPVFDAEGNVRNFIGFQQDVTPRLERQRQLQKIDRYLRHNLRNEMNIIMGMASLIRDDCDPPVRERAESVLDHGESLVSTMDKARAITELLREETTPKSLHLASLLTPVVERVRADHPDVDISTSLPDSVTVRATEGLATAVEELLRNAVQYNDAETPRIEVSARERAETVAITVTDNGPGIPSMEVDVLTTATRETAVYHGQGLGLWLVYLVSQQLDGTVEFSNADPRGSVVTLSVPRGSETT